MTLIEFFDKMAVENLCACLTAVPDQVIFVGDNAKLMRKHVEKYEQILSDRGHRVRFSIKTVSKSNLQDAIELLTEIVEMYDDCSFDITGGGENLLLALGIVSERFRDRGIQIHQFNLNSNRVYDCDADGRTIDLETPKLTVAENIKLYGGDIVYSDVCEEGTRTWELSPEFMADIDLIWSVCRESVRSWNRQINVLEAMEAVGQVSDDGLCVTVLFSELKSFLAKNKIKYVYTQRIMNALYAKGLLTNCVCDDRTWTLTYKNDQVKRCLTKAGQALEMKVFCLAKRLKERDGMPVYHDVMNGVVIDWDGDIHECGVEDNFDTRNEIDVLMMHHFVPIFVSCKNGYVDMEELYKLNTVATRFGGKYAKKVLIATSLNSTGKAGRYLKERAADMKIKILENVQEWSDAEFMSKIRSL